MLTGLMAGESVESPLVASVRRLSAPLALVRVADGREPAGLGATSDGTGGSDTGFETPAHGELPAKRGTPTRGVWTRGVWTRGVWMTGVWKCGVSTRGVFTRGVRTGCASTRGVGLTRERIAWLAVRAEKVGVRLTRADALAVAVRD